MNILITEGWRCRDAGLVSSMRSVWSALGSWKRYSGTVYTSHWHYMILHHTSEGIEATIEGLGRIEHTRAHNTNIRAHNDQKEITDGMIPSVRRRWRSRRGGCSCCDDLPRLYRILGEVFKLMFRTWWRTRWPQPPVARTASLEMIL